MLSVALRKWNLGIKFLEGLCSYFSFSWKWCVPGTSVKTDFYGTVQVWAVWKKNWEGKNIYCRVMQEEHMAVVDHVGMPLVHGSRPSGDGAESDCGPPPFLWVIGQVPKGMKEMRDSIFKKGSGTHSSTWCNILLLLKQQNWNKTTPFLLSCGNDCLILDTEKNKRQLEFSSIWLFEVHFSMCNLWMLLVKHASNFLHLTGKDSAAKVHEKMKVESSSSSGKKSLQQDRWHHQRQHTLNTTAKLSVNWTYWIHYFLLHWQKS